MKTCWQNNGFGVHAWVARKAGIRAQMNFEGDTIFDAVQPLARTTRIPHSGLGQGDLREGSLERIMASSQRRQDKAKALV